MAYQINLIFDFGTLSGLTLNGKLFNSSGTQVGSTITSGFIDLGNGNYSYLATIPSSHVGSFIAYKSSDVTIDAIVSINPQEDEPGVSSVVTTTTILVASAAIPNSYCARNDLASIVGEPAVLACIDDNQDGVEQPSESVYVTECIQRAAVEMNNALDCQYKLSDLAENAWCRWCNAYLACWHLFARRANAPPASVVDYVQTYREQLSEIRFGRFSVPQVTSSIEHTPSVSNITVEMGNLEGPVVVDTFRSTGATPHSSRKRHVSQF